MSNTSGRAAVVTGGAGGIGRAVCSALSEAGARVIVADLVEDAAKEVAESLPDAIGLHLDVGDPDSVSAFAKAVSREAGGADILVNNAGVTLVERFIDGDPAGWELLWKVNLRGPMLLARALLPTMLERSWGRIINISSDGARAGSSGETAYSATKAGLFGFTRSLAREVSRKGITVNTVCPGPTDTPMTAAVQAENPHLVEALIKAIPIGRLGQPEDIAATVAFVASEGAGYVTGQTFSVSGGITMA